MTTPARVAAAAVIGVLLVGGALFMLGRSDQIDRGPAADAQRPEFRAERHARVLGVADGRRRDGRFESRPSG